MASKKAGLSLNSLSEVRDEVIRTYDSMVAGTVTEREARSRVQVLSRAIYATNSIVRNNRTLGGALSQGNHDWAV